MASSHCEVASPDEHGFVSLSNGSKAKELPDGTVVAATAVSGWGDLAEEDGVEKHKAAVREFKAQAAHQAQEVEVAMAMTIAISLARRALGACAGARPRARGAGRPPGRSRRVCRSSSRGGDRGDPDPASEPPSTDRGRR